MTTKGRSGKASGPVAAAKQVTPDAERDKAGQHLDKEIEQVREHLGETVEALIGKTDITARAQRKATEMTSRAQRKAAEATSRAQRKAAEATSRAQRKATEATGKARKKLGTVAVATPGPVRHTVKTTAQRAKEARVPLAVAAAVVAAAGFLARRWRAVTGQRDHTRRR